MEIIFCKYLTLTYITLTISNYQYLHQTVPLLGWSFQHHVCLLGARLHLNTICKCSPSIILYSYIVIYPVSITYIPATCITGVSILNTSLINECEGSECRRRGGGAGVDLRHVTSASSNTYTRTCTHAGRVGRSVRRQRAWWTVSLTRTLANE